MKDDPRAQAYQAQISQHVARLLARVERYRVALEKIEDETDDWEAEEIARGALDDDVSAEPLPDHR
jgi:hypothetical protein